jgi:hypothetical protein
MNIQKLRDIIKQYKRHFKYIHQEEIYKWRAVKCFQDNWNITADNFPEMLEASFALTKNLLDSGLYYPKRMLLKNAEANPEYVRKLLMTLYDEEQDLITRITNFKNGMREHSRRTFPTLKNDYQDLRAISVYLCLRYPDRYYFYKYELLKKIVLLVDYPYQPSRGDFENILQYLTLCNILKEEILKDNELLELHKTRLTEKDFFDSSFNILTQDIIYAAARHIDKFKQGGTQESALKRLIIVNAPVSPRSDKVVLKGSFTNYIENEKENKRIGDLGELLVLQHEQEKLKALGITKEPEHKSKSEGDGLGYDILSYNEQGKEIFIEVKTTVRNYDAPFFITRNELVRSKQDNDKFFLYRLYDFDDTNGKAKYYKRQGDLSELCVNPVLYRAVVDDSTNR